MYRQSVRVVLKTHTSYIEEHAANHSYSIVCAYCVVRECQASGHECMTSCLVRVHLFLVAVASCVYCGGEQRV